MDDMKDSGIPWLGEIPAEWKINRFKFCYQFRKGLSITKSDLLDEGIPVISYGQIHSKENNGIECKNSLLRFVSPEYKKTDKKSLTDFGDTIWADTSEDYAGIGNNIRIDKNQKIFAGYHTIITHPINDAISKYHNYFFQSVIYRDQLRASALGVKVYSITKSMIGNSYIVIPPKEEQQRIADFLDEKCGEIDGIVAKIQQEMETLKQYKQSVISEAVTKGIRPNVPLKDSGIDYIGKLPESWDIWRVGNIGKLQNGISKDSKAFGYGYPFISYGDVYRNIALPEEFSGLVNSTGEERKKYSVEQGDIFFTRTSETIEEVGFSSVCEKTIPNATFAGFLIRLRPTKNKIFTNFAKYYFRSTHLRFYLVKEMNIVTRASLGQLLLKNMPVLLPPLEEQQEIAAYLDQKCAAIDSIISSKEEQLQTLASYKKSLIYEYVTGKKRVPTA